MNRNQFFALFEAAKKRRFFVPELERRVPDFSWHNIPKRGENTPN
jgi:hypothetical protein